MNRTLYMQVLDYDRFSRDDPIGEVCIPISEIDLSTSQTLWRNLQPCKGHSVSDARFIFGPGTDFISLPIFSLLGDALQKSLRLCRFKSDRDQSWHDCSSSQYPLIDGVGLLV